MKKSAYRLIPVKPFFHFVALGQCWEISPDGQFGPLIHWSVRGVAFVVLWAIAYETIATVKWIIANPVTAIVIVASIIAIIISTCITIKYLKKMHHHAKSGNA